jgi:Ca2+:H+ antiporter
MSRSKPAPYSPATPGGFKMEPLYWLLLTVPLVFVIKIFTDSGVAIFLAACVAIIPLAGLMGRATENLSETMGAGAGGLLNATFGNAAELIIALMALYKAKAHPELLDEMFDLVKASITGSIIGNVLLVLGAAMVFGGLKHKKQVFNRTAASMGSTLLALAAIALLVPAAHWHLSGAAKDPAQAAKEITLSEEIAVVLIVVYALSLLFQLRTHTHLFAGPEEQLPTTGEHRQPEWGRRTSLIVLLVATLGVVVISETLVDTVKEAAETMKLNHVFIGVIVVAVIGNAAEHSTAILVARKDKMDLAVHIAIGSSIQVALFVAPVLVFASMVMGHPRLLDLHFTPMETLAVVASIIVLAMVAQDGETHWMEGVMLLAVYGVLALAFFHLPGKAGH